MSGFHLDKNVSLNGLIGIISTLLMIGMMYGLTTARMDALDKSIQTSGDRFADQLRFTNDRLEVLSKRVYDGEQDRKQTADRMEAIRDRLASIAATQQVQSVVTQQIADQIKTVVLPPTQPTRR